MSDEPAIVVGAGYGYKEAVEMLSGSVMFCTDKAFPDCPNAAYVLSVNTEETEDVKLDKWYVNAGKRTGTKLVLPVTAHPSHVRCWSQNGGSTDDIYWMVPQNIDADLSAKWADKYQSPPLPRGANSGEFAWLMALALGHNPIGLIGMPYAWKTIKEVLEFQATEAHEYHVFYDYGKYCYTTLAFMEQRTEFLEMVSIFSASQNKTFNLSEGGILYDQNVLPRMSLEDFRREYLNGSDA